MSLSSVNQRQIVLYPPPKPIHAIPIIAKTPRNTKTEVQIIFFVDILTSGFFTFNADMPPSFCISGGVSTPSVSVWLVGSEAA